MKENISIIIPCYNTGMYIEKCLNSLIEQVLPFDYEIILIDDCSKDDTARIIENYISQHDYNILFLKNEKNIGAGASRNKAVQIAKYDYISFIDSDDYISEEFYVEMLSEIHKNDADLVCCDMVVVDADTEEQTLCEAYNGTPGKFALLSTGLAASPCNKIFKKEYLIKYPFAEGIMNEDVASVLAIVANCERVAYSEKAKYYYIQRKNSSQHSFNPEKRLDIVSAVEIFENRIADNPEKERFLNVVIYNQIVKLLLNAAINKIGLFNRTAFLKGLNQKAKKYNILQNEYYLAYFSSSSKIKQIFLKIYTNLFKNGFSFAASLFALISQVIYKAKKGKNVVKKNINIVDIVAAAKKNCAINSPVTVSAVIPNYNYAEFILERLYSILSQDYKINELIILDDCSTDNSREIIDEVSKSISEFIDIKVIYNKVNSGSPFKQWQKAFENASSDYVWIAEADDYCDKKLLSYIMAPIKENKNIVISYSDTAFINKNGNIMLKSIKPEIDLMKTGHWDKNYVNDGLYEIKNFAFLNCTIANVSSCVIKNGDYKDLFAKASEYKQAGDYRFYLLLMEKGDVAFINKPLNFYRVHGTNVTSTTKKLVHFKELKKIHLELEEEFGFNSEQKQHIKRRYDALQKLWKI